MNLQPHDQSFQETLTDLRSSPYDSNDDDQKSDSSLLNQKNIGPPLPPKPIFAKPNSSSASNKGNPYSDDYSDVQSSILDTRHQEHVDRLFLESFKPRQKRKSTWQKFTINVWNNDNTWAKLFLLNSCFFALATLALESFLFGIFVINIGDMEIANPQSQDISWRTKKRNAVATYLALYIYAEIYQVLFTLVVLYTRNIFHLCSSLLFLGAVAVYSGIQLYELEETLMFNISETTWEISCKGIAIAVICASCVLFVIQSVISWKLKDSFIQATGERIGNNRKLINANIVFNLHRDAIMLAWFFFPAFTLQFIVIALDKSDPEFIVTVVILAITFVLLILADYSATREIEYVLAFILICYLGGIGYLSFKLYRLFSKYSSMPGKRSLIAFDIFTIVLIVWLILLTVKVMANFGRGLKVIYNANYRHNYSEDDHPTSPEKGDKMDDAALAAIHFPEYREEVDF